MIIIILLILGRILIPLLFTAKNTSAYAEFRKMEYWDERKPCCLAV